MKKKLLAGLTVGLMIAGMTGVAGATQLLINSSFETGDLTGWTIGGTSPHHGVNLDGTDLSGFTTPDDFDPSYQNVRSGSYAAFASLSTNPLQQIWFEQTINTVANSTYDIGYWMGVDTNSGVGVWDADNDILVNGTSIMLSGFGGVYPGSDPLDFNNIFGQYATGAGETSVTVSFRISGSGTWQAAFSLDDFYFDGQAPISGEPIPEPATMLLFGTGIAVLIGAGRKKKQ